MEQKAQERSSMGRRGCTHFKPEAMRTEPGVWPVARPAVTTGPSTTKSTHSTAFFVLLGSILNLTTAVEPVLPWLAETVYCTCNRGALTQ